MRVEQAARILKTLALQQALLASYGETDDLSVWLQTSAEREAAEREVRRLLTQLGAVVADGVRTGTLEVRVPAPHGATAPVVTETLLETHRRDGAADVAGEAAECACPAPAVVPDALVRQAQEVSTIGAPVVASSVEEDVVEPGPAAVALDEADVVSTPVGEEAVQGGGLVEECPETLGVPAPEHVAAVVRQQPGLPETIAEEMPVVPESDKGQDLEAPGGEPSGRRSGRIQLIEVPGVGAGGLQAVGSPAAPSRSVNVTADLRAQLQLSLGGGQLAKAAEAPQAAALPPRLSHAQKLVAEVLEIAGATPERLVKKKKQAREIEHIRMVLDLTLSRWVTMGRDINHALTSWMTARLRAVQEDADLHPDETEASSELGLLFSRLSHHSFQTQPGAVSGLARLHQPQHRSWRKDARAHEARLRKLVGLDVEEAEAPSFNADDALRRLIEDVRAGMEGDVFVARLRALLDQGVGMREKRLVRLALSYLNECRAAGFTELVRHAELLLAEEEKSEQERPRIIEADWEFASVTAGRVAVIVGGDRRQERVARLQEEFGFASLEWMDSTTGSGRSLDSLVSRMQNGTVEMVIVLQGLCSHSMTDKLFANRHHGCLVVLSETYGIQQVRRAIERYAAHRVPAVVARRSA